MTTMMRLKRLLLLLPLQMQITTVLAASCPFPGLGPPAAVMDSPPSSDVSKILDLNNIRFQLIRLEDTITFHLIERVQFPLNSAIYTPGGVHIPGSNLSLFDFILRDTERLHSLVRRYESPDEYPFFPDAVETPILKPLTYPRVLHGNKADINVTAKIKEAYLTRILPASCARCAVEGPGADRGEDVEHYGSAATMDVLCLQALSRRIHYGKFVAESKFRSDMDKYVALIRARDKAGIDAAITDRAVEAKVLDRLRLKAKTYGTDPDQSQNSSVKINVDAVVAMYRDHVIPLTKEVEVEYLLQRLKGTKWE